MKKLGLTTLIIAVFAFQLNSFALTSKETKKYAWEAVKYELHSELQKRLNGQDIPVENILQAIDHMSHGEFDKAKQVISEEVASQIIGILVGSAGASVIGVAWNFAKSVYGQMIAFNEKTDILHFKRDFLKEQVESWRISKTVPEWKDFIARVNVWFDDRIGNTEIGKSVPYAYRKKYYEQLRSKIWAEALLIHTRYKRYFYAIEKAKLAAKRAREEIQQKVANLQMHYDIVSWRLEAAREPVNRETLERYDNDKTYRKLVNAVWAINRGLPKGKEISLAEYVALLKSLKKADRKYVMKAYSALVAAGIPATEQNIRLFIINRAFREKVINEANKKNKEWKTTIKSKEAEETARKVESKILNIKGAEYLELVSGTTDRISDKLEKAIKIARQKRRKNIELEAKGINPPEMLFFEPYIELIRKLANDYINGAISFSTFISYSKKSYESAIDYYYSSQNVLTLSDQKNWKKFKSDFRDVLNRVRSKRAEAMRRLKIIEKNICEKDDILNFINSEIKKATTKKNLSDKEIYEIKKAVKEFKKLINNRHETSLENIINKIEKYEKLKDKLKYDAELYQTIVKNMNSHLEEFYQEELKLIADYNSKKAELSNFTDDFGIEVSFAPMTKDEIVYSDELITDFCKPKVKEHYVKAVNIISNMENKSFELAFLYQQLLDYIGFLKTQLELNKSVYSMTTFDCRSNVKSINNMDKKLYEASDKAGEINGILSQLYSRYKENLEIINSQISSHSESLKTAISKIDKKYYKPLSFYESELKNAEKIFADCPSIEKEKAEKYNELIWYYSRIRATFNRIKLLAKETNNSMHKFENCIGRLDKADPEHCTRIKSEVFDSAYDLLYKLKKIEKQIYDVLNKGVEKNPYEFSTALDKAKVLPFKPFFDISRYEKMLKDYNDKHPGCGIMRIKAIYVNGRRVFRSIMITPNDLTNQGYIEINGEYEAHGDNRKCRVKTIGFSIGGRFKRCKTHDKSHFTCEFQPTKSKGFYVLTFSIRNYADYEGEGTYIFITYKRNFSHLERFLSDFENTYNSGKPIDKFFARGSSTTDTFVRVANENRNNFKHRLVFYPFRVIKFMSFEKGNAFWNTTIKLPWKIDGEINKSGIAIVKLTNYFNVPHSKTSLLIDQIEGDSFLSPFKTTKNKNSNQNSKINIAVLSHAKSSRGVGYSLDFETGKYSDKESDIAAGYVNPKVKGYDKPYFNVGMIKDMGKTGLNSVKVCPKSGYSDYYAHTPAKVGHTYCVRTQEGHYAKLEVIQTGGTGFKAFIKFKWVYGGSSNRF